MPVLPLTCTQPYSPEPPTLTVPDLSPGPVGVHPGSQSDQLASLQGQLLGGGRQEAVQHPVQPPASSTILAATVLDLKQEGSQFRGLDGRTHLANVDLLPRQHVVMMASLLHLLLHLPDLPLGHLCVHPDHLLLQQGVQHRLRHLLLHLQEEQGVERE